MGNAKQVIDFRPAKGMTTEQSNEHKRVRSENAKAYASSVGNYDFTREHLNFEITKGGHVIPVDKRKTIPRMIAENLAARGIVDPNEGLPEPKYRTIVNFILGGSRERMREIAFGNQKLNFERGADNSHIQRSKDIELWAKDMYNFMCERYGEDNIAAFVVHLDELNPHCHCTVLPIDRNNRFSYKKLFAGKDIFEYRAKTKALHDALAKVNEKWRLSRGSDIAQTGAKHRSTEEYRRHLNQECTSLEEDIEHHKSALADLRIELAIAEKRVKGLTTMIGNLEAKKARVSAELDSVMDAYNRSEGDALELEQQKERLERELSDIEERLADKREKLSEADQKLNELKQVMSDISERKEELRAEARTAAISVQARIRNELTLAMHEEVMRDFQLRLPSLPDIAFNTLDGSLLMDVAERSEEIIRCAMYLFAGYVDQATTFAQGHGGGGSGPKSGWGRDPDDDDRKWARRCMAMAARMMKSPNGKKRKR